MPAPFLLLTTPVAAHAITSAAFRIHRADLRVQFGADENGEARDVEPQHEDDDPAKRAVSRTEVTGFCT